MQCEQYEFSKNSKLKRHNKIPKVENWVPMQMVNQNAFVNWQVLILSNCDEDVLRKIQWKPGPKRTQERKEIIENSIPTSTLSI